MLRGFVAKLVVATNPNSHTLNMWKPVCTILLATKIQKASQGQPASQSEKQVGSIIVHSLLQS